MPPNPTRTMRVSFGIYNSGGDLRVDYTSQRRKSEGEVQKVSFDSGAQRLDVEFRDYGPSNPTPPSTPPRRREPLHRDNAPIDETYDSDTFTHSDLDARLHHRPSTPTRPRASRPSQPALVTKDRSPSPPSQLPSPPATPSPTFCSGTTQEGNPCRRTKKDAPEGWLCHSHKKSVDSLPRLDLGAGFIMRFDDFIPSHLHPVTQERMQDTLRKPPTKSDKPGYVYAFAHKADDVDARGSGELNPFVIKIGRTGSEERLQQRRHDFVGCSHPHQVEEIGWWPGNVVDGDAVGSFGDAILQCRLGKRGKYSYKVERLVHLELLDVAYNSLHLIPGYAQGRITTFGEDRNDEGLSGEWPSRKPTLPKERCLNCPRVHREIFKLKRIAGHDMVGREWEDVVCPIIEKWGKFMDEYGDLLHLITWV